MSVFGKVYADAYDALYGEKDYVAECNVIEALVAEFGSVRPIRRLLDFGCGTGSHALELAARGYRVAGIDRSAAMIARARKKVASNAPAVFHEGDIRNIRLEDVPYDGAIMMFAVLGYQRCDKQVRAALANARAHLAAGAALVFDVWYGPGVLAERPGPRRRTVATPTGKIVRCAESQLDERRHLCKVQYRVERWSGGTLVGSASEQHLLRFFFPEEFSRLASDCGFVCAAIRDFQQWHQPANENTWHAIGVFRAV
jgi:SAM-dependent methyltransferase